MIHMEIMVVLFKNHTQCINTLCGENAKLLTLSLVVHLATNWLQNVKVLSTTYSNTDMESTHMLGEKKKRTHNLVIT